MTQTKIFLTVLLLLISTKANADYYVAYQAGKSSIDIESELWDDFSKVVTSNRFLAGYRLNQFWSIELSYFYTPKFKEKWTASVVDVEDAFAQELGDDDQFVRAEGQLQIENKAISIVGTAPVGGNLFLFAKLGVSQWQASGKIEPLSSIGFNTNESEHGTAYPAALGMEYRYDQLTTFYLAADYFDVDADIVVADKVKLATLSLGIKLTL